MTDGRISITYAPKPGATLEGERVVLADAYEIILGSHAEKRDRLPDKSGPDDAKGKSDSDSRAKTSIP